MELRPASAGDRDAVIGLWEACGLTRPWNDPVADFDRALASTSSTILVGTIDGVPRGTAMVGDDGHRGWVYYVAVQPGSQGAGHGRALMAAAESWLRDRGCPKVELMVRETNLGVVDFYAALGYQQDAVVVLGRWLDPPGDGGETGGADAG